MAKFLRMTDLDLKGKRVFIRADLNVPVKEGKVTSDARITASMPTIEHALKAGARVMVTSHLGRPTEGEWTPEVSLQPVADEGKVVLTFGWLQLCPRPTKISHGCVRILLGGRRVPESKMEIGKAHAGVVQHLLDFPRLNRHGLTSPIHTGSVRATDLRIDTAERTEQQQHDDSTTPPCSPHVSPFPRRALNERSTRRARPILQTKYSHPQFYISPIMNALSLMKREYITPDAFARIIE